jgi:hypothetical protein
MRSWIVVLMFGLVVPLGSTGCKKEREKPAARSEPVAQSKLPPPLAQQAEPPPPKEERRKDEAKQDGPKDINTPPTPTKTPIRGGSVVRRADVIQTKNILKQLFIAARNFEAERNRFPNSREELEPYYEKSTFINEAFKEGDLVFIWKATKTEEPDKTVMAYEGQPDTNGIRVVLLANGDTPTMHDTEFKTMKKMPTHK